MSYDKTERLKVIDALFKTGKPVSFQDCFKEVKRYFDDKKSKIKDTDFNEHGYNNLFRQDIRTIREIINNPDYGIDPQMLITEGTSNRYYTYHYKESEFSIIPYLNLRLTKANYDKLDETLEILENNLPPEIFENVEFILKSRIEYDYGTKEKSIDYGENYRLSGRERLPLLYKCINKTAIRVTYKPFERKTQSFILHPYLLKQYNNRWFVFGLRPDVRNYYDCIALDRIVNIELKSDIIFVPRPDNYMSYFDDIIGVTKGALLDNGKIDSEAKAQQIRICINNEKTWKYITTKPIHQSQHIVQDFSKGYGVLELFVVPNVEFYQQLISIGNGGLRIISPQDVAEIIKKRINRILV